jgi:hypothetical protein
MKKINIMKIVLLTIGILLILNGLINISDDGYILAYDITSILSGVGFVTISISKKSKI